MSNTQQQQQQPSSTGPAAEQQEGEEVDELDALLQHYEQQAAADADAVQQRHPAQKRRKLTATEKREEALNQPLGADNKGFKLLAAMGYRQGQRIGKAGTGPAEPLPLLLKQDKLGLGAQSKRAVAREAQRQREQEAAERSEAAAAAAEAARAGQRAEYQQRAAASAAARRIEGQLRKAQQVCETLDTGAGVAHNVMWAHPPNEAAAGAAAAAAAAGVHHADSELLQECEPCHRAEAGAAIRAGRQEAADFARLYAHQAAAAAAAAEAEQQEQAEGASGGEAERRLRDWEAWQALPAAERLAAVLARLRDCYHYCLYCGAQYESAHDMQQHCPGPSEDDH